MASQKNAALRILRAEDSALLIIDPQTKLMPAIFEAERVTRNCVLLLRLAQIWSIPTVLTTQCAEGLGPLVPEIACATPGIAPLDKASFGCFGDEKFVAHIKKLHRVATLCWWQVLSHTCAYCRRRLRH